MPELFDYPPGQGETDPAGTWKLVVPQSFIVGPEMDPALIEDWPDNPTFKRIKPSALLDIFAFVMVERDADLR